MKSVMLKICVALLLVSVFIVDYSFADEIHLKNGDRISGKISSMKDDKLFIETAYAGKISISWAEIIKLKTDQEISVLLGDDTLIKGNTQDSEQGQLKIIVGNVVSRILLTVIFYVLVTPVGLIRRVLGADAMQLKKWKNGNVSVFQERNHLFNSADIEKPY